MKKIYYSILTLGVDSSMPLQLSDRIEIINKFCLLCITYTIPYIFFSIYFKFYSSALVFIAAQLLFILSLYFNKLQKFEISKAFVVIATNFSVFYLSLFYGFSSGFHLYYYTSPLIVMSLFGMDELRLFILAISIYLLSILILVVLYRVGVPSIGFISNQITDLLYLTNIFLALSFCILIGLISQNLVRE